MPNSIIYADLKKKNLLRLKDMNSYFEGYSVRGLVKLKISLLKDWRHCCKGKADVRAVTSDLSFSATASTNATG